MQKWMHGSISPVRCSLSDWKDLNCFWQTPHFGWCTEWYDTLMCSTRCSFFLYCLKQAKHLYLKKERKKGYTSNMPSKVMCAVFFFFFWWGGRQMNIVSIKSMAHPKYTGELIWRVPKGQNNKNKQSPQSAI